ncbi:MAG: hypothetical protein K9N55_13910 [Phycisphaerae bacterium]|nr:hypothetical protein [Phycisphaerae bacterium]
MTPRSAVLIILTLCTMALADPNEAPDVLRILPDKDLEPVLFNLEGHELIFSATLIPTLSFYADKDGGEINEGVEFDANLNSGSGYILRLGLGDKKNSLGFAYMTTRHTETQTGEEARMDALFLEGATRKWFDSRVYTEVGLGVGGMVFDLPQHYQSADGIAGLARIALGMELVEHVRAQVGAGMFRWGHPGETYGNGSYIELGGVWQF